MKRRTETCRQCGCQRWSQPSSPKRPEDVTAAWVKHFRINHRFDPRELPQKYPDDNRCQRCGCLPGKYRFTWDHDHWLERRGFSAFECSRGWTCRRCYDELYFIDLSDDTDGSEYMLRLRNRLGPWVS